MYPLGEYQFITSNVLAEYLCQKARALVNCIRQICNSEELPQTQEVQREEIKIETGDEDNPHPFPWYKRLSKKKDTDTVTFSDISLSERRGRFARSRECMSSQSSIKYSINDSILGINHRSIRKSVCDFFREEEVGSVKILSGKCGDVRIDTASNMVYKCFKPLAEIELPDEDKIGLDINKMAEEEARLFNLYYGAGSAEKYLKDGHIWVKMRKIEGTDLERLEDNFDEIIEANVSAFYEMLSRLFSLGICHGDFLLKNILFNAGKFYPIDFCQSSWDGMKENLTLIASITSFIQNKDEKISLDYELKEDGYHIALAYSNKVRPEENKKGIFILKNPAVNEKDETTRL